VETPDVRAEHTRLKAIDGVDVDDELMQAPGVPTMFSVRDPDGNTIALLEAPPGQGSTHDLSVMLAAADLDRAKKFYAEKLGFRPDQREYGIGAQILRDIGVRRMRLMTNNPSKYIALSGYGLEIAERVPLEVEPTDSTRAYLRAKREKLGHLLKLV